MQVSQLQATNSRMSRLAIQARAEGVQQSASGEPADDAPVDTSTLTSQFGGNSKFASVLAEALQRSGGAEVLTSGPERAEEP